VWGVLRARWAPMRAYGVEALRARTPWRDRHPRAATTLKQALTFFRRLLRPLTSFFRRLAYALLSEQGVRPAMSALAASTWPKPTMVASAAAATAVPTLLGSCTAAEHTTRAVERRAGRVTEACSCVGIAGEREEGRGERGDNVARWAKKSLARSSPPSQSRARAWGVRMRSAMIAKASEVGAVSGEE
jgi:hypothetical protein